MSIAVTEEHRALADSVRRWASRHVPPSAVRRAMEGEDDELPELWPALVDQGLIGLHLPEEFGGVGYGLVELAVLAEELGRACVPGPLLPTALVGALVSLCAPETLRKELLPGLSDGSVRAALAMSADGVAAELDAGTVRLTGTARPVLQAHQSDLLLLGARTAAGDEVWAVIDTGRTHVSVLPSFDGSRRLAEVSLDDVEVPGHRVIDGLTSSVVRELAVVPYAAEAAGIAGWCLDTATAYAKVREQFGRPIGQFQGVKHLAAEMLVKVEEARAAAWDAAQVAEDPTQRALASSVAAAVAFDAAVACAKDCIQILGGIGFTWEHDAHLYLRRATTLRQLFGGGREWNRRVAELALSGVRRTLDLSLEGDEAQAARDEVRTFLSGLADDERARVEAIADAGYVMPHWPSPWGRDASAVEQLVIDEEFARARVKRPNIVIGGWILPTIIEYGTVEQQELFIRPTLRGDLVWAQLFSEPGAGSDLAALQTKATRVEGGWTLTGQKVWTTLAHKAQWGLCLARTNPDAPKHDGITAFLVDMASEGIDIRPLREITGNQLFNEIFLTDVFVPDAMVCGPVDGGWKAARTTLANERVAMSSGSAMGSGVEKLLTAVAASPQVDDPLVRHEIGALVCEGEALGLLGYRTTLAALSGTDPGATSSVRKLVGGEHAKKTAELALELLGADGATTEAAAGTATFMFVQAQCLTIAGGTTNVQRNVIAERLLGLPRDP